MSNFQPKLVQFHRQLGSLYLSIDGPEFVGKTTLLKHFAIFMSSRQSTTIIREPGHTFTGQIIRKAILDREISIDDQLKYLKADRIITQQLVTKPRLMAGDLVISDRSCLASFVYQGLMHDNLQQVKDEHNAIPEFIYPDLAIFATCPLEVATKRFEKRRQESGAETNYYDLKEHEFHEKLHDYFNRAKEWCPIPFIHVDFNRSVEEITKDILVKVEEKIGILL